MKTILLLLLISIFLGCNKTDDIDPLSPFERKFLKSLVSANDIEFMEGIFSKLVELNKYSTACSTQDCVRKLPRYIEIMGIMEKNNDKAPAFFDFYLYDKRVEQVYDIIYLYQTLIWDIGEKHYPDITKKLMESEKYKTTDITVDLIKEILGEMMKTK